MSETPETDAVAVIDGNWDTKALRMGNFARELERERDVYKDALQRIYDTSSGWFEDVWANIEEVSAIAHNALHKTL